MPAERIIVGLAPLWLCLGSVFIIALAVSAYYAGRRDGERQLVFQEYVTEADTTLSILKSFGLAGIAVLVALVMIGIALLGQAFLHLVILPNV